MKLTLVLLTAACLTASASGRSQSVTLSGKNLPMEKIFVEVEKQTGYFFTYPENVLKISKPVDINVKDLPLLQFLEILFKEQPLKYSIESRTINISINTANSSVTENAQVVSKILDNQPPITGRVTDVDGKALEGVNVSVKGSKKGTITDVNGMFSLNIEESAILEISNIGYATKEISYNGKSLSIVLELSTSPLDEVQIIAYGKTSKRLNTGNVSTIKSEDISKQPINNPLQSLTGRIPGLFIDQESGATESAYKITIRGQNSISNGNEPLFVIDGIPYMPGPLLRDGFVGTGNPLSYINSANIESIDVLKDADATAIYGSRGANGVILITTKKGKVGKASLDVNVYHGINFNRTVDLLGTKEYLNMRNIAFQNDQIIPSDIPGNPGYAPDLKIWDTTRYTDWQDFFINKNATVTDGQVSYSGGTQLTRYDIGVGYRRETTVFPGDFHNQRMNAKLSLTMNSADGKLSMQVSASYLSSKSNLPSIDPTKLAYLAPDAPKIYSAPEVLNWENSTWTNPYSNFLRTYDNGVNNLMSNFLLTYKIIKGLQFQINAGYNKQQTDESALSPIISNNPAFNPIGISSFSTRNISTVQFEPYLNYTVKFGKGTVTTTIGTTINKSNSEGLHLVGIGYTNDALLGTIDAAPTKLVSSNLNSVYKYNALFGKLSFDWNKTYLLNFTGRRDGSSRFGPGHQFANFGAIGVGIIASNYGWWSPIQQYISFAKLRGSYGTSGNDQIGDYQYLDLYLNSGYSYQGVSSLFPYLLYNPNFSWETNKKGEVAIDLGFLKDRILFSAAYYVNKSSSQLVAVGLPSTTGFTGINENFPALIQNDGLELSLTYAILNGGRNKVGWRMTANFTKSNNQLKRFDSLEKNSNYSSQYVIGQPLNIQKRYKFYQVDPETGVYSFLDKDGKPTFAPSALTDKISFVNLNPVFYGGFENSLSYNGLECSFLIDFTRQQFLNTYLGIVSQPGTNNNNISKDIYDNSWRKPGDESTYQKFSMTSASDAGKAYNYMKASDFIASLGTIVRLRSTSISYNFRESIMQKMGIKGLRIYAQGMNLLSIGFFERNNPLKIPGYSVAALKSVVLGINVKL